MSNTRRRDQQRASIGEVLRRIRALVQRAAEDARRPPITGTRRPWAVQAYLDHNAWRLIWQAVDYLHDRHFDLYSRFLHERTIADHIVDLYAEAPKTPATAKAVIAELERIIDEEGTWIIEVPIAHAVPVRASTALDKRAMLVRGEQVRDWDRSGTELADPFAVFNHLGDELRPRPRWLRAPTDDFVDIDTRWTSALLFVEEGTEELAVDVARYRAELAVAVWTLLQRPRRTRRVSPAWPTVSLWAPAPHLLHGTRQRAYAAGKFSGRKPVRGSFIRELGLYKLPTSEAVLAAPFVAMREALRDNDCAVALLAAARWLYLADYEPNVLTRPERLFCVWSAREALRERGMRGQGDEDERWETLFKRLRVRAHLRRRGYGDRQIELALTDWSKSVRDLTAHRADSVLVGLDFRTPRRPQMRGSATKLGREDLALAVFTSRWPILLEAVRFSARLLTRRATAQAWDARWFHQQFEHTPRRPPGPRPRARRRR